MPSHYSPQALRISPRDEFGPRKGIIESLCREFPAPTIRSALIRKHISDAALDPSKVRHAHAVDAAVSATATASEQRAIADVLAACPPIADVKCLEGYIEALMDPEDRRAQGSVYTPQYIIRYLIQEGLRLGSGSSTAPAVLDPACGAGGFLIEAVTVVSRMSGVDIRAVAERCVFGVDIDPNATAVAAALLELTLIAHGRGVRGFTPQLHVGDTLLLPPEDLLNQLGVPEGFDLVVTNPPYVKLQNLPPHYRQKLLQRFPLLASGSFSSASLFVVAMLDLLREQGCAAAITQNNLFTSLAGKGVRAHLQKYGALARVIDFGHNRVFADASAYTCLLFLAREARPEFEYASVRTEVSAAALDSLKFSTLRHSELRPDKWRLAEPHHRENLARIEATGPALGQSYDIRVGFATLKDRVFFVQERDGRCWGTMPSGEEVEVEKEATRPAVRIADFSDQAELAGNRRRVLFPYRLSGSRYRIIEEKQFSRMFPLAYRHLTAHREILDARDKARRTYETWYAWGRTQGMTAQGPKLLTKTFDRRPNFMLDESDSLFCNGYAVFVPNSGGLLQGSPEAHVLQAILNSRVMHYYAVLTSFQIEGGFQCYQKNFIERFGVPEIRPSEQQDLLRMTALARDLWIAERYGVSMTAIAEIIGPD